VTPQVLVLMGVSGSGKTTVAEHLAARLGWPFQEGDSLHPPANVEKMRAGQPLTDEDRAPWLATIAAWIDGQLQAGQHGIVTCSALKRSYRDTIVGGRPGVRVVYLHGDRASLEQHVRSRHHEFMPTTLLDSQLATLQEPTPDEHAIQVEVSGPIEATVNDIVRQIGFE